MRRILTFTATAGCLGCVLTAASLLAAEAGAGRTAGTEPRSVDALRNKQEAQQRARGMAKELISGILDIQLKQLKENGLDKLPIYAEIVSMRKNIDKLVEAEMLDVVDILIKAQNGPAAERQARFNEARDKIREIVVKLSVERQNLLRRLKIAELSAQVRRLIQLETGVLKVSQSLPEQAAGKREQSTLATIEDQRDVIVLFSQLVAMLGDVSTWGGPVGAGAADGLRILKAGQVDKELDGSIGHLESARFGEAVASERAVIHGLEALWKRSRVWKA